MTTRFDSFIRAAAHYRNPESPWWKKYGGAILMVAMLCFISGVWYFRRRRIARLESEVEILERRAASARKKAALADQRDDATALYEEALRHRQEAKRLRGELDDEIMSYLEDDVKIKATKDWESLEALYEDLD